MIHWRARGDSREKAERRAAGVRSSTVCRRWAFAVVAVIPGARWESEDRRAPGRRPACARECRAGAVIAVRRRCRCGSLAATAARLSTTEARCVRLPARAASGSPEAMASQTTSCWSAHTCGRSEDCQALVRAVSSIGSRHRSSSSPAVSRRMVLRHAASSARCTRMSVDARSSGSAAATRMPLMSVRALFSARWSGYPAADASAWGSTTSRVSSRSMA